MDFFCESCVDSERKVEIRAGRVISCKKTSCKIQNGDTNLPACNLLFIHGSCAASMQYNSLIESMKNNCQHGIPEVNSQKKESIPSKMNFYSFDQLGCGDSKHPSSDWYAFSSSELLTDLKIITEQILRSESSSSLYLVAHSHGCSQVIKLLLLNSFSKPEIISRIASIILIGGALKGGPAALAKDGGHVIFKILPTFILNRLQPSLSNNFFNAAVHPNHHDKLRKSSLKISNDNSMEFCKAYYRQQKYASIEEASKIKVRNQLSETTCVKTWI